MWTIYFSVIAALALCQCRAFAQSADSIKGVTVSAQTWGSEWGTPEMAATLDELKSLGANWVAIHPYAKIQADGALKFSKGPPPDYLTKPLDWANERNLQMMLVPHIATWGTQFLWRGEIRFTEPAQWDRFFSDYETWIALMAKLAEEHHAKLLCIGLEYSIAQKFEDRWRRIIRAVRAVYHGKITYGANWDQVAEVPFWDAVDYIGVLGYFPVSDSKNPSPQDLAEGWRPWMAKLETLSKKYGKPVVFTEIGYNENERCAAQPWDFHRKGGPNAAAVQARCIEQALKLPQTYPFLTGMFFWKWFPDLPDPEVETFDLRRPWIKRLLAKYWLPSGQANLQP